MSEPRHAATVILTRPGPRGLEIALQKRHRESQFMGGAYVFPGGKLDPEDCEPRALARLPVGAKERCFARFTPTPGTTMSPEEAAGLHVAACRETFEEAGVLLARKAGGAPFAITEPAQEEALAHARLELAAGRLGFAELLEAEDLTVDLDGLVYWAHWVTPTRERRRYDTRFFVAHLPAGQVATADDQEAVDLRWYLADEALMAHQEGHIFLPPPTQRSLQELAGYTSLDQVRAEAARRPIGAIMPKLTVVGDAFAILMPWDPDYAAAEGGALPGEPPKDPRPDLPSRIMVRGGV